VDTPEKGEKCFTEATEFTRRLVGTQVRLEYGPRLEDTYGRRLAYVFEGSGESIDAQLIAGGLATAWTRDGQYKDVLLGIEQAAIANGRGCLWSDSQDESAQYDYVGITNQLIKFDSEWRALTTFSQGLEGGTPYAYFSGLILQSFDFDHVREKLNVIKFDLARTNVPDDLIPIKNELSEIYEIEINAFGFDTGEWNADVTPSNVDEVISVVEAVGQASGPLEGLTRRLYDNQWTEAQLMRKKLYEYWMTEMLDKGLGRDFVDAFATDLYELGAITTFGD